MWEDIQGLSLSITELRSLREKKNKSKWSKEEENEENPSTVVSRKLNEYGIIKGNNNQ